MIDYFFAIKFILTTWPGEDTNSTHSGLQSQDITNKIERCFIPNAWERPLGKHMAFPYLDIVAEPSISRKSTPTISSNFVDVRILPTTFGPYTVALARFYTEIDEGDIFLAANIDRR